MMVQPPKICRGSPLYFLTLENQSRGLHIKDMAHTPNRPGLRERVAMRKRGIDPDRPGGKTKTQKRLKMAGLVMQMVSVFLLLGYMLYYTQGVKVSLHVDLLVIVSGVFVLGRILTFLSGNNSFRF